MTSKPEELWCHECGKSVPGLCKKHGGFHQVVDNVIPTYARLTLPPGLTIKSVKLPDGSIKTGVFAKKIVQCRSQFGPLIAPVKSREKAPIKEEPEEDKNTSKNEQKSSNSPIESVQKSVSSEAVVQNEIINQGTSGQSTICQEGYPVEVSQSSVSSLIQDVNTVIEQAVQNAFEDLPQTGAISGQESLGMTQDRSDSLLNNNVVTGQQYNSLGAEQAMGPYGDGVMSSLQNGYSQAVTLTVNQEGIPVTSSNSDMQVGGVMSDIPVSLNNEMHVPGLVNNLPVVTLNSDISAADHFNSAHMVADLALQASLAAGITTADALSTDSIPNSVVNESQFTVSAALPVTQTQHNTTSQPISSSPVSLQVENISQTNIECSTTSEPGVTDSTENDPSNNSTTEPESEVPKIPEETYDLKIFTDDGYVETLDIEDEMKCSWMMFVRPATNANEQNLVVYQFQKQLYFVSIKPIPSNTELRVWYSADYAKVMDKHMLSEVSVEKTVPGVAAKWVCSVCYDGFGAFADLEAHVCPGVALGGKRLRGRPRKGRPRKYIKPTKSWRARLEKTRFIKPSTKIVDPSLPPRKRGRPPKVRPAIAPPVEKVDLEPEEPAEEVGEIIQQEEEPDTVMNDVSEYIDESAFLHDDEYIPAVAPKRRGRKKRQGGPKIHRTSKREPMQCPHCEEKFTKEALYVIHVSEHTGIKPYICEVPECAKGFMSKFKLERHRLIHTCPRHHKCPYCDKSFNRKDHLKNHLITHDPNKKRWVCEECGKEYSYHFSYRTHKAFHDAEAGRTTECGICHKNCENREALLYHLKVHSGARSIKNCTEKTHACMECGKKFYTRKDVRRHMITHTKRKDFLCQYCPQRFGRKDHLTRHLRSSHSGDNPNAKPPRAPRGERKDKEKRSYEHLMPPSAALTIPRGEDPAVLVTSQPSLNNIYPVQALQADGREMHHIPIPLHMYNESNGQQVIAMANVQQQPPQQANQLQQQQQQQQQQQTMHAHVANQMTVSEQRYAIDASATTLRHPGQGMESPAPQNEFRPMSHVVQGHGGAMYLGQPQQHHTMMKQDNNMELARTNGVLTNDYQGRVDQTGRPTVLQTSEGRQAPTQTFSTLLGYMETLRFLENLPTNAQGVIAQMDGSHPPTMVPLNTTPYSTTTVTGIPNSVEIQKRMPVTHHNAYQQGS